MAEIAKDDRFDVSTDFQKDKGMPCWNRSSQPGATYFMSNLTLYVLIHCLYSCGHEVGMSRFSINLEYARSEEGSDAKTSNDTLRTLENALLGSKDPTFSQHLMFRTGYDKDDKIG